MAISSDCDQNTVYRGFDASFKFDLTDVLATDVDLVGASALFTIKADRLAPDADLTLYKDFIISSDDLDASDSHILYITFDAEEMTVVEEGTYYCDLKIFDADGNGLAYMAYQEIHVIDDVTDRIVIS